MIKEQYENLIRYTQRLQGEEGVNIPKFKEETLFDDKIQYMRGRRILSLLLS